MADCVSLARLVCGVVVAAHASHLMILAVLQGLLSLEPGELNEMKRIGLDLIGTRTHSKAPVLLL